MIYSKQRQLILSRLRELKTHPTADTLYQDMKPENPGLSLATVYRNLNQMAENGMVRKIAVPQGADRFDGNMTPHHHMICERCGKMVDIGPGDVPEIDFSEVVVGGCRLTRAEVIFYGLCPSCNSRNN